jgi:hypothetical protein
MADPINVHLKGGAADMAAIKTKAGLRQQAVAAKKSQTDLANQGVSAKQKAAADMLGAQGKEFGAQKQDLTQQAAEGLAANAGQSGGMGGYGAMLQAQNQAGQGLAQLGLQQQAMRQQLQAQTDESIYGAREKAAQALMDQVAFEAEAGTGADDDAAEVNIVNDKFDEIVAANSNNWVGEDEDVAASLESYAATLPPGAGKNHALYLANQVRKGNIDV